jgi:hypothetical protein
LLPPWGWLFCGALPSPLVESSEESDDPEVPDEVESSDEPFDVDVAADEPSVEDELLVPLVVLDAVWESASLATPTMSPTVSAPAAAAATVATAVVLLRRASFMATTIGPPASGRPHRNVKACSRLGGSRLSRDCRRYLRRSGA